MVVAWKVNKWDRARCDTFKEQDDEEIVRIISARKATKNENQTASRKVPTMKDEYDFSDAEQGKFYRPIEELEIPIYLDKEVREFFMENLKVQGSEFSLTKVINALLRKDIEISDQLSNQGITRHST